MDIWMGLILIIIGFISAAYGTMVGAGGGFVFVPALLILLQMEPKIAAGTGLVVVLLNALSGIYGFVKQKRVDFKLGLLLFLGALPGTLLGVWLANIVPPNAFYAIFAFVLILLGLFLFIKREPRGKSDIVHKIEIEQHRDHTNAEIETAIKETSAASENRSILNKQITFLTGQAQNRKKLVGILFTGLLLGIVSSFFGIGGGWLLVPILVYLFRINAHIATATSIFSLSLYTIIGVGIHWAYGNIDWSVVLWGGIGVLAGAQLGVFLSNRITGRRIMQMLAVLLVAIGVELLSELLTT